MSLLWKVYFWVYIPLYLLLARKQHLYLHGFEIIYMTLTAITLFAVFSHAYNKKFNNYTLVKVAAILLFLIELRQIFLKFTQHDSIEILIWYSSLFTILVLPKYFAVNKYLKSLEFKY